jgi:transcription elongation factor Elf1
MCKEVREPPETTDGGKQLTAEDMRAYVGTCPFCGEYRLLVGIESVQVDGGVATQGVLCESCGAEFTDLYVLVGIDSVESSGNRAELEGKA